VNSGVTQKFGGKNVHCISGHLLCIFKLSTFVLSQSQASFVISEEQQKNFKVQDMNIWSKVCDDGILIQLLCFWTLSIVLLKHTGDTRNLPTSLVDHLNSQPSSDISPIWTPIIAAEVKQLWLCPVYIMGENCVFMLVPYREFVSLVMTSILIVLSF
jgi:hypothetical protein